MNVRVGWLPAAALVALVGCSVGGGEPEPAESIPPMPAAEAGWESLGSFGGSGPGVFAGTMEVSDAGVAVHASCIGNGTLVVTMSATQPIAEQGVEAPAAVFECGGSEGAATSRVELEDVPVGDTTATAYLVEAGGTFRHAAFHISIEQPAGAASD